ncbi:dermonecrotic toxin domain-containing protein [Pseudomonas sp. v388]|uniref:dermonecrotic toxin domain-containing protein n=1 Tax=Pseudomonas sp. v388 TaxID=2479849 RepID=UPI002114FFA5|nr:DUF6543 domain-containing protein [Pseudomonas sp. v388]
MKPTWSPYHPHALHPPSSASLEMPAVLLLPAQPVEKTEALTPPPRFSLSPFHYSTGEERVAALADDNVPAIEPDPQAERRLRSLRKSPGFALLAESVLLLKVYQLDMDLPPRRRHYLRDRLKAELERHTGVPADPDQLYLTFTSLDAPSVDDDGTEHYTRRLSLTDVAQACFDPWRLKGLRRATLADAPVSEATPSLRAAAVFDLISKATFPADYHHALAIFWARQREAFRTLSKLGFLDGLARQVARKRISRDGYALTLDALGLRGFPQTVAEVERSGRGERAEVWGLSLNDERIPGIFQVRSKNTSHCFIHVVGAQRTTVEYITDDPAEMTRRLLAAVNDSGWHRQLLEMLEVADHTDAVAQASRIEGDVFSALTRAQESVTGELLGAENLDRFDLLKPVARALSLASAVEFWQTDAAVLPLIPEPSRYAAQLMGEFLATRHGLTLNADQVFIAHRRGHATTPLGDARTPATYVNVPDETPLSLSQALMTHYQVQYPAGYIDHGGRTVVYLDRSGKGVWSPDQELAIEPHAVEQHIRELDFLRIMSKKIVDFWGQHTAEIERAFTSTFITQALTALKQGRLKRGGFDQVVRALAHPQPGSWVALGFHVQGSAVDAMSPQYPGLLMLEASGGPKVLYQAGHAQAFMEFHDDEELQHYLRHAAADERWRQSLMHYVPVRSHERLDYLLRLWGGVQAPDSPASLLRPWTDALYNLDTRKALHQTLVRQRLDGLPFGFLREALKHNALQDAQERIVTAAEISLRYWTSRLNQLQLLLIPMSVLLTPAFMASLATEIGVASLTIASARLPGSRYTEKKHALLALLSLGLLRLGPQTPRLLRSLGRIMKSGGNPTRNSVAFHSNVRGLDSLFRRSLAPRQTRLEKFFHTNAMLKRWTIPSHPRFGTMSVHAWKLGRRFLLWTSDRGQARTLVVSTHGHYLPWSSTVKIPHGTEIQTYAPHGYILVDPMLHRIVNKTIQPFALSSEAGNTLVQSRFTAPPLLCTDKMMAGTSLPGRLKNYTLSKFQSVRDETYDDIAHIVRNSNVSPLRGQLPATPMDVLTVRNRLGMPSPTLADLFNSLYAQGIHYDRILLVHCRCAAIAARFGRVPVYQAPTLKPSKTYPADLTGQLQDALPDDLTQPP